jgi:DedD protein
MDKVLKRRLIGASILIALAVIFVPMLLVDPDAVDDDGTRGRVDVPPLPETAREVRRIPLNPESPPGDAEPAAQSPDRGLASADDEPVRPEPDDEIVLRPELDDADDVDEVDPAAPVDGEAAGSRPGDPVADVPPPDDVPADETVDEPPAELAQQTDPAVEPEPAEPEVTEPEVDQPAADTEAPAGAFVVQVASFGSDQAADRVRARLEALGHRVQRDEIVRGQTLLYRLRTGPYADREAAETALAQIAATVDGVDPIIRAREAVGGAGRDDGFAVQVGSFVSEDNAESETERLAALGFDAFRFSEQIGDRLIWRVLVGPVADRSAAEDLERRLVDRAGVEGLVVSYP